MRRRQKWRDAKNAVRRRQSFFGTMKNYFKESSGYGYWIACFIILFVVMFIIPRGVALLVKILDKAYELGIM